MIGDARGVQADLMSRARTLAALACLALSCGSSDPDEDWFIDAQLSDALTVTAYQSRLTTGVDAIGAITVLQVFESTPEQADVMEVDSIRQLDLVLETRDRDRIVQILSAAKEDVQSERCPTTAAEKVLHFLAFDPALHRVGYFRYYPCPDGQGGGIVSSSGPAVSFTTGMPAALRSKE